MALKCDVVIAGAGLAGLVAACELAARGKKVVVVDQEGEQNLGGQAFWSLGGLFMVDSHEQRRLGIQDSAELAYADWMRSAGFDRETDHWPSKTAEAYIEFAAGDMRSWLRQMGMRWFPIVGWAERGGSFASGHGNSVPRFHITWGTGPGVLKPFVDRARNFQKAGTIEFLFRHRVDRIETQGSKVTGVSGAILEASDVERGEPSSQTETGDFRIIAECVLITSGGMGGNFERVRKHWPEKRMGKPPDHLLSGVPAHVDGRLLDIAANAGAALINEDRMWHYTEGVRNWAPIWPYHGIRILPGPSSMWFDAFGKRLPAPCFPGFDTLATLSELCKRKSPYSWFVLNQAIIEKEFALSGSEQNPDFTSGRWLEVLKSRLGKGAPAPVEAFKREGADFIVRKNLEDLLNAMKAESNVELDIESLRREITDRDRQMGNRFTKDAQVSALHAARNYIGDRLIRTAKPHRLTDPLKGPMIAVKLHILTRKSLGGIHTNLDGQVLDADGAAVDGLYAAGECAGFGGGGFHGYNALEGTFLGGCIFSGRSAGRHAG